LTRTVARFVLRGASRLRPLFARGGLASVIVSAAPCCRSNGVIVETSYRPCKSGWPSGVRGIADFAAGRAFCAGV
jgi:hypothetical protein